jgi:hypothetical protein
MLDRQGGKHVAPALERRVQRRHRTEHKEVIDLINRLHQELDTADAKLTVSVFLGDLLRDLRALRAREKVYARSGL